MHEIVNPIPDRMAQRNSTAFNIKLGGVNS